jgi:hypothetical protein
MRHIAMVRFMNKVILKGITHIDWRFKLTRWDKDNPQEVDLEVMRSVREIMMEKKVCRTKAWILTAQLHDGRWARYYTSEIGNESHKKHALKWSEGLSSYICFHLLHHGINGEGINDLIRSGFGFKAASEAAKAVLGKNGRVMS